MVKINKICIISLCLSLGISCFYIPTVFADDGAPLTITIHEIEQVDDIDWWIDSADWSYKIQIYDLYNSYLDGTDGWIDLAENVDNPMPERSHSFNVKSSTVKIYITLADREGGGSYDIADISSRLGGGMYGWTSEYAIPSGAQYKGNYNLITKELTGDVTVDEMGYKKTSGDYDGSGNPDVDEQDAHLWFKIISDYSIPSASMSVSSSYVSAGTKVNFDGTSSTASAGCSIVKYEWDFEGDGYFDVLGDIASNTYNVAGTFNAQLRVTDTLGETNTLTQPITVVSKVDAYFVYSPSNPTTFDTIQFTDRSEVIGGNPSSWYWNFRDGTSSTEINPAHKFSEGGTYTVTLKVTTEDNQIDYYSEEITVIALSNITGTVSDSNGNPIDDVKISLYLSGTLPPAKITTTNSDGKYYFTEISAGTYDIKAAKTGYDNNTKTNKEITAGENTVDFTLTLIPDENKDGKGTPGFELILVLIAIALVLFWQRKRI